MYNRGLVASWTLERPEPNKSPYPNRKIHKEKCETNGSWCFVTEDRLICDDKDHTDWQPANPTQKKQVAAVSDLLPKSGEFHIAHEPKLSSGTSARKCEI